MPLFFKLVWISKLIEVLTFFNKNNCLSKGFNLVTVVSGQCKNYQKHINDGFILKTCWVNFIYDSIIENFLVDSIFVRIRNNGAKNWKKYFSSKHFST